MAVQKYPVGIDLGTTFSSLAYLDDNGQPQAFRMTDDDATGGSTSYSLASAVYFKSPTEVVVGNRALDYSLIDATRIATRFKRQMGEPVYQRPTYDEQQPRVPFEVDGTTFRPEELSAMVLKRLKQAAEPQLGPIEDVVISVPFVFDESRRQATQNAGRIAGFKNVELIDEPVAAAIAYGHNLFQGAQFHDSELQDLLNDQKILVYDLGGGTFDATLVQLQSDGKFKVLATNGDERLGGSDWDDILLKMICAEYVDQIGEDPRKSPEIMQELLLKTIEAKKTLSAKARAELEFEFNGRIWKFTLTNGEFQSKTRHLVSRTTDTITEMLTEIQRDWNYCDKILVVGGASRMPMIKKHIEQLCDREVNMSLSPDTAIAHGAALFAALKSGKKPKFIDAVETVNSHALGLLVKDPRTQQPVNDIVIPHNSRTRVKHTKSYVVQDPVKGVTLVVMQGNSPDPDVCLKVGRLRLVSPAGTPLPPPGQKQTVAVSYSFQDNGLLRVEGRISSGPGRDPVAAAVELELENSMSENEVNSAVSGMRGIEVE